MSAYQEDLEVMAQKVSRQQEALDETKKQVEIASSELAASRYALSDITNQLKKTTKQRDTAHKQAFKYKTSLKLQIWIQCIMRMKCWKRLIT